MLNIFKKFWEVDFKDIAKVKSELIKGLPKGNQPDKKFRNSVYFSCVIDYRIRNILLFLSDYERYVPIASQNHKDNIWRYLGFLLPDWPKDYDESTYP